MDQKHTINADSARGNIKLLMTPGPTEVSPRVLKALASPLVHHYYGGFIELFDDTINNLKKVYQTKNDVVILQGEGVLALEASVRSILSKGDRLLLLNSGPFGKSFGGYAKGVEIDEIACPQNEAIDVEEVKRKLDEREYRALTVVHCETPTGIMNDVKSICNEAKKRGVITIVDAVSSLGGVDIEPQSFGIDLCITASQKCLSCPPSLSMISVSDDDWEVMEKVGLRNSYLSILDWRDAWDKKSFPYTPFISEIYALNESLNAILEEGLQNVFRRHKRVADCIRKGVKDLGLELWPENESIASDTVTAIKSPSKDVVKKMEDYGILIAGSVGELRGKVIRIGHMGYSDNFIFVQFIAGACLHTCGASFFSSR